MGLDDDPRHVLILSRLLSGQSDFKSPKFFSGSKAALDALDGVRIRAGEVPDLIALIF